jgi:hypothetical protein
MTYGKVNFLHRDLFLSDLLTTNKVMENGFVLVLNYMSATYSSTTSREIMDAFIKSSCESTLYLYITWRKVARHTSSIKVVPN